MLEEISEQPDVLEKTIARESAKYRKLGDFLRKRDIDLVVIAARGSSDNASLFGRYLLEVTAGIPVSLAAPAIHDGAGSPDRAAPLSRGIAKNHPRSAGSELHVRVDK